MASKHILIVAATTSEILPLIHIDSGLFVKSESKQYLGDLQISTLITGLGGIATAAHVSAALAREKFYLTINAGIAGAYNTALNIGQVVNVSTDRIGDLGAEMQDGQFADPFDLGLESTDSSIAFKNHLPEELTGNHPVLSSLREATGLTVNTVSGTQPTIDRRKARYHADVESMEGAAFLYTCQLHQQPAIQIRSISNYVTIRDRDAWNIPLAIQNLNAWIIAFLHSLNLKENA